MHHLLLVGKLALLIIGKQFGIGEGAGRLKLLQINLSLINNAVDNAYEIIRGLFVDPFVLEGLSLTNAGRLTKFSLFPQ